MEKNDTLRNLLISAGVFILVLWGLEKLVPQPPQQRQSAGQGQTDQMVQPPLDSGSTRPAPATTSEATVGAGTGTPSPKPGLPSDEPTFAVIEADDERTLAIGSGPANGIDKDAPPSPYRMRLELSNIGASIESATMTDHAETLGSDERYKLLSTIETDDGRRFRSLSIEGINVDGTVLPLHGKRWHAQPVEETGEGQRAVFWIEIHENGMPALRLTRVFELPRQEKGAGLHDLKSDISVENLSERPHQVIVTYRGGLGIRRVNPRFDYRVVNWGIHDGTRVTGRKTALHAVVKDVGKPIPLFSPSATEPNIRLSWAATANTYFTCTIAPLNRDGTDNARYLQQVTALDADGDPATDNDATLRVVTSRETVGAGKSIEYPADVYLGEKDGDKFRQIQAYMARNYYYQVAQAYPWCTFTWLVELMVWLLNALFWVVHDFGVAIIILVLVVRALLHPITKKGQVNMVRMQQNMGDLAPKMEEIKKRYANDKAHLQQETMKLYREHGINPATQVLTCLPMFIQMPIWVALYISLSNNVLMRHLPAIYGITWIDDLTAPDALYTFASPIHVPIVGWEIPAFNLLPILVSVFMYLQQKMQPKPTPNPNATDQQRQQQEMMQKMAPMMSIMMLVIFYMMPSGLNLYIMASTFFGVIEQHLIRKHIKARKAAGTLTKPDKTGNPAQRRNKPAGKMSFIRKLQNMAEDARKAQASRPTKKKRR